jgi:hypothetical protein
MGSGGKNLYQAYQGLIIYNILTTLMSNRDIPLEPVPSRRLRGPFVFFQFSSHSTVLQVLFEFPERSGLNIATSIPSRTTILNIFNCETIRRGLGRIW